MEPQYSVFLYSKFSPNCKQIMNMMRQSGVDFGTKLKLQFLCIDHAKIRSRVMSNESMDINLIPCILIVYPNGGVEKYEAAHAFKWVEEMISRLKPPPPPQPIYQPPPPVPRQRVEPEESEEEEEYEQEPIPPRRKKPTSRRTRSRTRSRRRMKPIQQRPSQGGPAATSINDIPIEDGGNVDTMVEHQNRMGRPVPPQARIRRDRGNYEDEDIDFRGSMPEISRQPPGGAVKDKIQPTRAKNPSDIMAKAALFAQNRDKDTENMRIGGEQMQNRP